MRKTKWGLIGGLMFLLGMFLFLSVGPRVPTNPIGLAIYYLSEPPPPNPVDTLFDFLRGSAYILMGVGLVLFFWGAWRK